jgi:gamma-glutamylcyclotransferase (GGCT)/AIG2-like uncharacterized protein YtfP
MGTPATNIFVYGTLRRGGSNAFRMDGSRFIGPATVRGRLYHIDWYPGLVLDPGARKVIGEIHQVGAGQLAALDAFEGAEYRRVSAPARLVGGESLEVMLWEYLPAVDKSRHITSGDWFDVSI